MRPFHSVRHRYYNNKKEVVFVTWEIYKDNKIFLRGEKLSRRQAKKIVDALNS